MEDESSSLEDIKKAIEGKTDAQERLRDANMALTEATIANVAGTDDQRDAWYAAAEAAGLTIIQIRELEEAYRAAAIAQQALTEATIVEETKLAAAQAGIAIEATQANQVNDRFREAGSAGLIKATDYADLDKLTGNPKAQIALMEKILARIERLFAGGVPAYAKGTAGSSAGPAIINEAGAELVTLPSGSKVATAAASKELMANASGITSADAAAITAAIERGMVQGFRGIRQNERASA
jgi:hypothetical protein